jgi:hypothetical protein
MKKESKKAKQKTPVFRPDVFYFLSLSSATSYLNLINFPHP